MKSPLILFIILAISLFQAMVCAQVASATRFNSKPLPSERELKDFEGGQTSTPSVSRFARRLDYREEEKLKAQEEEAMRMAAKEKAAQAEAQAKQLTQKRVQDALDANNRGVNLGKQGRFTEAIQAHEQACQIDSRNKQYKINLSAARCAFGQERLAAKDYDTASGLFRKALVAAPDNGMAAKLLAETMKKQGKDPLSVEDRIAVGEQLLALNDVSSAMVEYQSALQLESSARTYTKMGDAALQVGQTSTACNWYSQAIVKDPNYAPAQRQFGLLQMSAKDFTGAAASLRKAVILDPKDAVAGQALVEIWRRQVASNPLLAENHLGLAAALQLTGDFNGADSEYGKLEALDRNNPGLASGRASLMRARQHAVAEKHKLAAQTLFNQGLRREALAEVGQAVMMEPKNASYQFLLGRCLEASGDLRGAHQAYLTCVLIDPEKNQEAAYRMKEMQQVYSNAKQSSGNMPQSNISQPKPQTAANLSGVNNMSVPQNHAPQMQAMPQLQAQPTSYPNYAYAQQAYMAPKVNQNNPAYTHQYNNFSQATPQVAQMSQGQAKSQRPKATAFDAGVADQLARVAAWEANKEYDAAISSLRQLSQKNLQDAELHHRLAVDLLAIGSIPESISEFRIASALRPANKEYAGDLARAMSIHKRSLAMSNNINSSSNSNSAVGNSRAASVGEAGLASGKEVAAK